MTELSSPQAAADAHAVRMRVAQVFAALSTPAGRIERELLSEADIAGLVRACPWPRRVLLAGGGGGFLAATLALLYPDAEITCVDPDLPLDAELAAGLRAAQSISNQLTDQRLAKAAARQLNVEPRIEFIVGGFAEAETSRSGLAGERGRARIVGVDVCARLQPIDLVMVAGLSTPEARAADIRLAASALAADGVIATRGVIGASGATVRAGVFEFLRYYPDFVFLHARHTSVDESLGILKRRQAGWPAGYHPPGAGRLEDGARETMADLVALAVGGRPILEAAVGESVLEAYGRERGLQSRTLRLSATDWSTHFFDPIIEDLIEALGQRPESVLFSADLLDHAPDEFIGRLFARLSDHGAPGLFFATPPGEREAAGPMCRPVARILDIAVGQGLTAYAPAALEFERARHEGSFRHGGLGSTSRAASLVLLGPSGGFRDARGRRSSELTTTTASVREQVELQRIHSEAGAGQRQTLLAGLRRDPETEFRSARERATSLRTHERSLEDLQNELDRLRAEAAAFTPPPKEYEAFRPGDLNRRELSDRLRLEMEALSQSERARFERDLEEAMARERTLREGLQIRAGEAARAQEDVSRLSALLATADSRRDLAERQRQEIEITLQTERAKNERLVSDAALRERALRDMLQSRESELERAEDQVSRLSSLLATADTRREMAERQRKELEATHIAERMRAERDYQELALREREAREALEARQAEFADHGEKSAQMSGLLEAAEARAAEAEQARRVAETKLAEVADGQQQTLAVAEAHAQELDYRLKARDAELDAVREAQKTAEAQLAKALEDLKAAETALQSHGEERGRLERELTLMLVRAEAAEKRPQLDPELVARLETKIQTLAIQREDERALRGQLEAAQRDLADLRERSNRLSALVQERDQLISTLQQELRIENIAAVEVACRESDTRVSLEGIASHLALAQSALERFQADPASFGRGDIAYPVRTPARLEEDLHAAAKALHGQAADISQEVARQLEAIAGERRDFEAYKADHYRLSERAHIEALDQTLNTFRTEHTEAVMDEIRTRDALEHAEDLLERIYARVFKDRLNEVAEFLEPEADAKLDLADRIILHERRLAHLLHAVDANAGVRHGEAIRVEPETPQEPGVRSDRGLAAPVAPVQEPPRTEPARDAAPGAAAIEESATEETPPPQAETPVDAPEVGALFDFDEPEPDIDEDDDLLLDPEDDKNDLDVIEAKPEPAPAREPERKRDVFATLGGMRSAARPEARGETAREPALRAAEPARNPFARPKIVPLGSPIRPGGEVGKVSKERIGKLVGAATTRGPESGKPAQAEKAEKFKQDKPSIKLEPVIPPARKGSPFKRWWARLATYPETLRLLQLQKAMRAQLMGKGLMPRVFDAEYYAATGGYEPYDEPLHHYLMEGENEGRWPLAGFDPNYYAQRLGDLSDWNGSLLRHFLTKGVHAGIPPSEALKRIAEDARAVRASPLEYFFQWEQSERKSRRGNGSSDTG